MRPYTFRSNKGAEKEYMNSTTECQMCEAYRLNHVNMKCPIHELEELEKDWADELSRQANAQELASIEARESWRS